MTIHRKIILTLGALALGIVLATAPKVRVIESAGGIRRVSPGHTFYEYSFVDKGSIVWRGIIVIAATGYMWLFLKEIEKAVEKKTKRTDVVGDTA